ncbi:helix-turn-helix domain-containing protein [Streptomyces sp. NPDC052101]|uniref:helix-turn-helix domain-containing protein n=1 Tax=Streptomyces sp. NPDC052101 TaxID=3155763 RepID=UPI003441E3F0
MHEGQAGSSQALSELRRRLEDGVAAARLKKTQLAARAEISRTTIYDALRADGPVPSLETVTALARALKLPLEELQELQRRADRADGPAVGPGRPLSELDPHDLEIHPASDATRGDGTGSQMRRALSGYVERDHDRVLAEAVREAAAGRSRMVVLVGSSSTGKTRACWEAVQPLAELGWLLWHPPRPWFEAAFEDMYRVGPRTVVWLNEAQHYLGDPSHGERIAAAVHHLLSAPECAPVLVLATLWPGYASRYTALPSVSGPDPHSRTRELLSGRHLTVPDTFDDAALETARSLAEAGDVLLAGALTRAAGHGRVAQDLAGAPELLRRYEEGTPAARAILEVAMDARRLGVGPELGQSFLADAATDYFTDFDYQHLTEDWAEAAYAELASPVHGKQAPLSRTRRRATRQPPATLPPVPESTPAPSGPTFRLADYLEQDGRTTRRHLCPPASFWHAAYTHLNNLGDLQSLSAVARAKYRLQWAHHLGHRAAEASRQHHRPPQARHPGHVTAGGSYTAAMRELARRERAANRDRDEALLRQAVDAGNTEALLGLAGLRKEAGDRDGAEALLRQAADAGASDALLELAGLREQAGDRGEAEALLRQAVDAGNSDALFALVRRRERAGDRGGVEALLRQAVDTGSTEALLRLAGLREQAGDRGEAEALLRQAVDTGNSDDHLLDRIDHRRLRRFWPYGLNPDGTPTAPWS